MTENQASAARRCRTRAGAASWGGGRIRSKGRYRGQARSSNETPGPTIAAVRPAAVWRRTVPQTARKPHLLFQLPGQGALAMAPLGHSMVHLRDKRTEGYRRRHGRHSALDEATLRELQEIEVATITGEVGPSLIHN